MSKYESNKARVNSWANRRAEFIKENNISQPEVKSEVKSSVTKVPKHKINQVNLKQ